MTTRFKLSDKDRDKYGGPEWVTFDKDKFNSLSYDELAVLEAPMLRDGGLSLTLLMIVEWPRLSMRGLRGMLWLTRQLSGLDELKKPAWEDFKPDILGSDFETVEESAAVGDDDPPAGGSSEPPSAKTARSKKA